MHGLPKDWESHYKRGKGRPVCLPSSLTCNMPTSDFILFERVHSIAQYGSESWRHAATLQPASAARDDYDDDTTAVRDLAIYIDADLSMRSHVQQTVTRCFAVLRQLRSVRRSVPTSVFQTLVVALVLSKLDYGNATLGGLPANLLNCLQSVLNAAARSIADLRRSAHITDTLTSFHCSKWQSSSTELFTGLRLGTYLIS